MIRDRVDGNVQVCRCWLRRRGSGAASASAWCRAVPPALAPLSCDAMQPVADLHAQATAAASLQTRRRGIEYPTYSHTVKSMRSINEEQAGSSSTAVCGLG